jgi:hypothetical protein
MSVDVATGLAGSLAAWVDEIRLRPARRSLIRYSRDRFGRRRLALDPHVAADPEAPDALRRWLASRGRDSGPVRALIHRCEGHRERERPISLLPPLAGPVDLEARLSRLHPLAAPGSPRPAITWARTTRGTLRSIRFGCYDRRAALIRIHPRLARPWVADLFVDAVIHHELCHHRQACEPVRGERVHSARFRAWDRAFPGHHAAEQWMRDHLHRLLAAD